MFSLFFSLRLNSHNPKATHLHTFLLWDSGTLRDSLKNNFLQSTV